MTKRDAETAEMRKRLLLWDIDGTLLHTGRAGIFSMITAARELFGTHDDLEDIEFAGKTDRAIIRDVLARHKQPTDEQNMQRFAARYLDGLPAELPRRDGYVLPGIVELLTRLKERPRIVLGLLTGNLERGAKMKLDHYRLWQFFEFGAFADDHHDRNELGAFARERAREKHGHDFDAADIDVIGDTGHDIACGKAFGARTIAVATGTWPRERLAAAQPDFLFDDLSAVDQVVAKLDW
jgi:phosphoglycolate phosphatase-like HAD superfamily hydrolase